MAQIKEYSIQELQKELSQLSVVKKFTSDFGSHDPDLYDIDKEDILPEVVLEYFVNLPKTEPLRTTTRYVYRQPEKIEVSRSRKTIKIKLYTRDRHRKAYIKGEVAGKALSPIREFNLSVA